MAISPSINGQNSITNGLTNGHHVDGNNGTSGIHAKPRVFALDPLHSEALTFAEKHFDLVLPCDEGADQWREEAQGLLVRGSYVTAEDLERAASTKGGKLKYISKQGTGVDKIDTVNARKLGIPVMNTPGVNVSKRNCVWEGHPFDSSASGAGGCRTCFRNDAIVSAATLI